MSPLCISMIEEMSIMTMIDVITMQKLALVIHYRIEVLGAQTTIYEQFGKIK